MKKYYFLLLFIGMCSISFAQVVANEPDAIILCDVNNPGDQVEIFDLTIREGQIIGSQTNVVVTYHLTSGDALGNGGFIASPNIFENTSTPQTIFIRVENINNGNDWQVTTMQIIVPFIPEIVTPAQDIVIEDTNNDGFEEFDLTRDESDVLGGQDPFDFNIFYFETQADADANVNPIATPESYTNTTNPQTIYTRFAPLQDQCQFESYNFDIFADPNLAVDDLNETTFSMYPNPVTEVLNIEFPIHSGRADVSIVNLNGARVIHKQLDASTKQLRLSVVELPVGIYFIRITSEGYEQVQKLVKK